MTTAQLTAAALCLLAADVLGTPAAAAIYRCTSPDAPPRFAQFPCGGGAVVLEPQHTMTLPGIDEAEQRLLDELERQHRVDRDHRARALERAAGDEKARREARRARCQAARSARAALERQRRKGYRLSEARELDRREAELEAEERQSC